MTARGFCHRLALRACRSLDRRIMVRLVKGAYWDTEIKRAQVLGLAGTGVHAQAEHRRSYIACAKSCLA